jgi:hypothetical protein
MAAALTLEVSLVCCQTFYCRLVALSDCLPEACQNVGQVSNHINILQSYGASSERCYAFARA